MQFFLLKSYCIRFDDTHASAAKRSLIDDDRLAISVTHLSFRSLKIFCSEESRMCVKNALDMRDFSMMLMKLGTRFNSRMHLPK